MDTAATQTDQTLRPADNKDSRLPSRISFGFGGRLLLAFGVVAATTMVAGLVAWIVFSSLSSALDQIEAEQIPAMTVSVGLAEKGSAVIATAPLLIAAQTEKERLDVWAELQVLLREMKSVTDTLSGFTEDAQLISRLNLLLDQIANNLLELDLQVRRRFVLAEQLAERTDRLRWIHADFLDEVAPITEDARFNLETVIERIGDSDTDAEMAKHLNALRKETRKQAAVLKLNASGNLAVGLLVRGSVSPDLDTLNDTVHFHGEVASLLESDLEGLEGLTSGISLRQICQEILSFSVGSTGLFTLRQNQLEVLRKAQLLLDSNRGLLDELKSIIAFQMEAARAQSAEAVKRSDARLARGKLMLLCAVIASLMVAVAVGWFYVGRNLVARVLALSDSMRSIADGDLQAHIPTGGRDEISIMAEALLVFRDTAIAVEEANAQAIIDNAQAGLITTDENGRIEFFNPTASALFGYGEKRPPARYLGELIAGNRPSLIDMFFQNGTVGGDKTLLSLETMGQRSDGSTFPMDIAARIFKQRRKQKFIVTLYDITERKQAQVILERRVQERTSDLRRANEQLQREISEREHAEAVLKETQAELVQAAKLAAMGQMAAGIAHELNQPLAAIRSYTHNVGRLMELDRSDEAQGVLGRINMLTERMADISKHLKTLARRPGKGVVPIRVTDALHNALTLFDSRIQQEGITVTLNLPDNGLRVLGEEIRMEQVFINLISNALDAMASAAHKELAITASMEKNRRYVQVVVADTGKGLTESELSRIFDPFYTTKEVGQGLGLGLSISYNIIKDWDGSLKAIGEKGKGASFIITMKSAEELDM